jgi:hypothetical protein
MLMRKGRKQLDPLRLVELSSNIYILKRKEETWFNVKSFQKETVFS